MSGTARTAQGINAFIAEFNAVVLCLWLTVSLSALALSRYARRRARQGDRRWAKWSLLPLFECVILVKKVGLALMFVQTVLYPEGWLDNHGFTTAWDSSDCPCIRFGTGWLVFVVGIITFEGAYIIVLFALCSYSGGTRSMWRALSGAVTFITISVLMYW